MEKQDTFRVVVLIPAYKPDERLVQLTRELKEEKLDVLLAQQADLSKAIEELIEDIEAGRKYMKTYKQMKMYNDPALNPVLYGQKK